MKTELKKLEGNKREINIEVNGDIVKNKFDEVFAKIGRTAKVPGFRDGHAPREILEKHYASTAQQQVLKELIPGVYNQALQKEGLEVIDLPKISDVRLDKDNLSFKAEVEVTPEIKLKNYTGLKVIYKKIEVSPDEVKRNIDALKESRKIETVDDDFARGLSYPNLSELEKAVERQIFMQKENLQRQRIEGEIIDKITKDLDFKLPQSLVERQLQELIRQAKVELALRGLPRQKIEEEEKTLPEKLKSQAKEQVKVYLVLAEIAKRENIPQDDHMPARIIEFLLKKADWQEIS